MSEQGPTLAEQIAWLENRLGNVATTYLPPVTPAILASLHRLAALEAGGDGWKLTPREATPEMVDAMRLCTISNSRKLGAGEPPCESPWSWAWDAAPTKQEAK